MQNCAGPSVFTNPVLWGPTGLMIERCHACSRGWSKWTH